MKKNAFLLACSLTFGLLSCGDNKSTESTTETTTSTSSGATDTSNMTNANSSTTSTSTTTGARLVGPDSTFVMKAAMGGMMEVEAGNLAQQNASSDRVKAFAMMMVNDHSRANQELMSFASGRGMTLPTTLPDDMRKHMDAMKAMQGKAFDRHYMDMMVNDHKKTIADFEKESSGGNDTDLKAWAAKTLPTLQAHRDSALAVQKTLK